MKDTAELKLVEQEDVQTDLRELFRGAVKMTLESVLEETVLELCGAPLGSQEPGIGAAIPGFGTTRWVGSVSSGTRVTARGDVAN